MRKVLDQGNLEKFVEAARIPVLIAAIIAFFMIVVAAITTPKIFEVLS